MKSNFPRLLFHTHFPDQSLGFPWDCPHVIYNSKHRYIRWLHIFKIMVYCISMAHRVKLFMNLKSCLGVHFGESGRLKKKEIAIRKTMVGFYLPGRAD